MPSLFENLATGIAEYQKYEDPVVWAREKLGIELWSKQQEIVRSVQENQQTAVRSAHGTGKSLLAAILALWWIDIHPIGSAYVITTAPSYEQVHSVIWESMRTLHNQSKLSGTVQQSDRWLVPLDAQQKEVGIGRRPADYNQSSFQGIHYTYVLMILDEACGIPVWIWNSAISMTTSEHCRVLAIGNPDDPNSEFAAKFNDKEKRKGWNLIKISIWDSPKFTKERIEIFKDSNLSDQSYVDKARQEWGEGTAIWQSKIEGEFPTDAEDSVIPNSWVQECFNRYDLYDDIPKLGKDEFGRKIGKVVACDPAVKGRDKTIISQFRYPVFLKFEDVKPKTQKELALLIAERTNKAIDKIVIDVGGGYGDGAYELLLEWGYNVVPFSGGSKTKKKDATRQFGFTRIRSAAYWKVRQIFNPNNEPQIAISREYKDDVEKDLCIPTYKQENDIIQVEPKSEIRKRLGRSTDYGDTVVMTLWVDEFDYEFGQADEVYAYNTELLNGSDVDGVYSYEGGEDIDDGAYVFNRSY